MEVRGETGFALSPRAFERLKKEDSSESGLAGLQWDSISQTVLGEFFP